jgi:hypothetical protein
MIGIDLIHSTSPCTYTPKDSELIDRIKNISSSIKDLKIFGGKYKI